MGRPPVRSRLPANLWVFLDLIVCVCPRKGAEWPAKEDYGFNMFVPPILLKAALKLTQTSHLLPMTCFHHQRTTPTYHASSFHLQQWFRRL